MGAIDIIRERMRATFFSHKESEATAKKYYESMKESEIPGTYMWDDVDYNDDTRAGWLTAEHYERIRSIIRGFGEQRLYSDQEYVERLSGAIRFWLERDFINPNWWCNEIGAPWYLSDACIAMFPVLSEDIKERMSSQIMSRASFKTRPEISANWTGANLIWGAMNTIRHAVLANDEQILKLATDRAAEEIYIGGKEGIQEDGSFYQHGPRLYSGGYGLCYVGDLAGLSLLLVGTEYQFDKEKLQILTIPVLDGLKHMTQGVALDWTCVGRNISRKGSSRSVSVKNVLNTFYKNEDMPRREETEAALKLFEADSVRPDETKYFPKTTYLCHHFDGLFVGAKFLDNKTYDAEICNNEGELCYNMSYGTHTTIMRDGYEYADINPIWDYSRVPGTTSRTETDGQLLAHRNWWCLPLPNDSFCGEQKGKRAVIHELAEHDGIKALVTDFAYEGGFVCLGAQIEDTTDKKEALVTTVDQCFLRGEVRREGSSYIHNGIRYTPLGKTIIEAEAKEQVGSWKRNNFPMSDDEVRGEVLTLTIKHKSGDISSYGYVISAENAPIPDIEVIKNDSDVQAIRLPDGSVMAAFITDCEICTDGRAVSGNAGAYIE